jgi:citrate lyase subunit beta/citryl-CoA lyase
MRLRSLLFVPGDRPDQIAKALGSGADAVILDLEDAVSAENKGRAREAVAACLADARQTVAVFCRVNPLDSGFIDDDLAAIAPSRPDGLVLPKAEGPDSVLTLAGRLEAHGGGRVPILPIASETPRAVFALGSYAAVGDRLCGLTWGAEDLPVAIGATAAREADGRYTPPYEVVRTLALMGAHAAGVPAIETVYPAFRDLDGLSAYARRGRRDGFTGMMAIHPEQVGPINAAFAPTAEEIAQAHRVIDLFAANAGAGSVALDGRMLDAPHLLHARRLLATAQQADLPES